MKNLKNIILGTLLTFSLGAFAVGAYASIDSGSTTLIADVSNQYDEDDVG